MLRFKLRNEPDPSKLTALIQSGLSPAIAPLLLQRGISTPEEAAEFLNPSLEKLHSPFLMKDMRAVVERINNAITAKKRIMIYGDYDADGVSATALLLSYLRGRGAQVDFYIPDRHEEGYGLNMQAVEALAPKCDLLLTVDCGITSIEEVAYAKQLGLDVIVTDHHHALDTRPDALILNCRLDGYPFPYLAGVGVALKLVHALGGLEEAIKYFDIAAIGTVADIVNLTGENRVIVYYGLKQINENTRQGILALLEGAGVAGKELTSTNIGYNLGPMINAGGRIGHSANSVEMLCTNDKNFAADVVATLKEHNQIRQTQEAQILEGALKQIENDRDFSYQKAVFVASDGWNPGVIGIVASRLAERYTKPTFVLAKVGDQYVASARSIRGVNLFAILQTMPELFVRYGGHEMAAGLTIKCEQYPTFKQRVEEQLALLDDAVWIPTMLYDQVIRLPELTPAYMQELECLQPFGQGNQIPVYLLEDAEVTFAATMGAANNHLRMSLRQEGISMEAAAFKMGYRVSEAQGSIDAAVVPELNTWQGRTCVRLMLRQFAPNLKRFAQYIFDSKEKHACGYFQKALTPPIVGFKRHLAIPQEKVFDLLKESIAGTLLLYTAPETATEWLELLTQNGLLDRVFLKYGTQTGTLPAYNLLCAVGAFANEGLEQFKNIILLDELLDKGLIDHILAAAPSALVFTCAKQGNLTAMVNEYAPDVQTVRLLYKALRAQSGKTAIKDLYSLSVLLQMEKPMALPTMYIALKEIADMGLIRFTEAPFSLEMVTGITEKKDFYATQTYLRLQERITKG